MRRFFAILLIAALSMGLFAGCKPDDQTHEGDENTLLLNTPNAMVSFGNSAISGIETKEPADLTTQGTSEKKTVSTLVGDYSTDYTVRTLKGYSSEMTFSLEGVTPNAPAMIDIEEIHLRTDSAISYGVYINGVEVYGRSYAVIADGPNHAYFDIPASVVGDSGKLTVRIVNRTDSEVRFQRVWAISDPETVAAQQGIDKKMDVVLMLNEQPNNLNMEYLKSLVDSYKCAGMYNIGLCWEIQYLQWGKKQTETWLNNVFNASIYTGATLYLGINSWWGGTPSGPDGQGGYWQDVAYQQITYDKNNMDNRGNWQLSSPNEWSNTPWLSMNNDYYNEVRVQRIKETVEFIQLRTAEIALAGKEMPPIHLYTENEPYYWPINWTQYDFDKNPNGVGDFSTLVVQDAAADGITLDPTDGLSQEEAFWLYRNLNTYISEVGQAMSEGLGYNYITIKDGVVSYPTEQIVNDSYSHTPIHSIYPNWDENRRAWENHVLDSIHFGGEWSIWQNDDNSRSLDYLLAYGSFSNINAERAGFPGGFNSTDFRVLSQCYAYGLEGVIIYNVLKDSDQQNVINVSTLADSPMEARVFAADPIFTSDFSKRTGYSINNTLIAIDNMRWDGASVMPADEKGGSLTYCIANDGSYSEGLRIAAEGSFVSGGSIEILAGKSLDDLKSVGIFPAAAGSVSVDSSFYEGGDKIYIKARLYGDGMTAAQMTGLCVTSVGLYRGGQSSGCTDGSVYTYSQNRTRCQIIAARADTERMLNRYLESCGGELVTASQKANFKEAYDLYAAGRYGEAFASISQSISQLLPATFVVSGYGQLGDYPVYISTDEFQKITVTLKEVSEEAVRMHLSANEDATVSVSLLTDSGKWSMTQTDDGDWLISAGDTAAKDGKVTFDVEVPQRSVVEYPLEFEARIWYSSPSSIHVQSQDIRVTDYCHSTEFQFTSTAVIRRGIDGTASEDLKPCDATELKQGDYVRVTLNEDGRIVQVDAWYGKITGTVVAVEQVNLDTMSNPFVTVQLSDGTTKRLEVGYDTKLTFTGATGELGKLVLVDDMGLSVGQSITIDYCPYEINGRIRALQISD